MSSEETTPDLAVLLNEMNQQITVLGLALGCALKAEALRNPEQAKSIEENLKSLVSSLDTNKWEPRAMQLLDVLYAAMNERQLHPEV